MVWLTKINYLIIILILIIISMQDIYCRVIANKFVIALGIACCTLSFFVGHFPNVLLFIAVLLPGVFLSAANIIGGGDIKLISTLALLFTPAQFANFLLLTSLFGGALAVFCTIFSRKVKRDGLPYGVAISFGFLFSFPIV
ncbi:prepilin peptidase CpaA [Enterobacter asburiae]|uniref:A24 family peptidase n=1 Tax=Enterobacter asburiae TaxID=61645 RepID=UPI00141B322C|nr:prepilin peptidase [Enterobacter asburiae]NIH92211.1 prepilin peptidase CpaA [Enterobacter asburiae]